MSSLRRRSAGFPCGSGSAFTTCRSLLSADADAPRVPRTGCSGCIEGRPLPYRSSFEGFSMPDRITLFQGPIERAARGPEDVPRVIADTLWHEIAHYFGMDERQVRRPSGDSRWFSSRSLTAQSSGC